MGLYLFRLPDVGEGVAEAEIAIWHVKPGDTVKEDQSLVDVITDKATVDMTSPVDGLVKAVHGEIGSMVPVGSVLVELEVALDEDADHSPGVAAGQASAEASLEPERRSDHMGSPSPGRIEKRAKSFFAAPLASPSVRRRAKQAGLALEDVAGSGPNGRILAQDLDTHLVSHLPHASAPAAVQYGTRTGVNATRIIGLRRKIAEKMQEAKRRIPHIAYVEEIDVTQLEALRQDCNANKSADQPKLTLLPFFIRALVRVLPDFPQINARYDDDEGILQSYEGVHVGIATQTPGGLMVPVVRHAENRDIWSLAAELARLGKSAREGTAKRDELSGSTITITSLGTLGGITTTPIINHPEVAIIGPNKIVDRPVIDGNFVTVRKMMNLSSSFDHRIVDGYDAALFVQRLKRLIEHPALIFMD